jgi:hypothetical protein
VLTVLPKALPDRAEWDRRLAAADKQHTVGEKFNNQLAFARSNESVVEAQKYISARFSDCLALDPSSTVPDFPGAGYIPASASADAKTPSAVSTVIALASAVPPAKPAPARPSEFHPRAARAANEGALARGEPDTPSDIWVRRGRREMTCVGYLRCCLRRSSAWGRVPFRRLGGKLGA